MAFWTSVDVEPKRKNRFLVELGSGFMLPSVKTCTKPTANVDIKEFQLINHKFKYPGIVTWQPIKITFVDMAGLIARSGPKRDLTTPEKASTIANAFGSGLLGPADTSTAQVINSAKSGGTNNQSIKIHHLTPDGKKSVETWILHNPQIASISWGDLAYDSDDFIEYSIEVAYDFAEMQIGGSIKSINNVNAAMVQNSGISSELEAQKSFEDVQAEIARRAAVNEALDNVQLSDTSGIGGGQDLGAVTGMGGGTVDEFQPIDTASIAESYKSPQREKKDGADFSMIPTTPEHEQLEDAWNEKRRKEGN